MVEFEYVHDAALLHATIVRFLQESYYTRAGPLMLSVNPFRVPVDRFVVVFVKQH